MATRKPKRSLPTTRIALVPLARRVDLSFAVHQLPAPYRPSLLAWLRRYTRTLRRLDRAVALPRHTRTFYQLDPTTGTRQRV